MNQPILLTAFTFLTMLSCTGQINKNTIKDASTKNGAESGVISTPPASVLSEGNKITFTEGENKFLKEFEMNVTFDRITEDSRCPTGVKCVWEGVATAEFTVMGTYTRPRKIILSTLNNAARGYSSSTVFNDYAITLLEVQPYPTSGGTSKIAGGKYKVVLQMVKK